jgi:hypothetical protein
MNKKAPAVGIVLGVVFVIVGFGYGNPGTWMSGLILLALGMFFGLKKE